MHTNESGNYIFVLDGSEIIIGRDKDCDISVSGVGVSRKHLSIRLDPNSILLNDLQSTFGVRVNNLPVNNTCLIVDNDQITVGVQSFKVAISENNLTLIPLSRGTETIVHCVPEVIQIGRDPENQIYLPHPLVSRVHASVYNDSKNIYHITDHRSANGTYVNGCAVSTSPVTEDDIIQIGPYRLQIADGKLIRCDDHNRIRLDVCDVSVIKKGQCLLDRINCKLPAGEFIAILGPSGAGKSTFVQALTGSLALDSGEVHVNGLPLSRFLHAFSSSIGYLSQESVLFNELTVGEMFREQCLLRLPSDSTPGERSARVQEVVELLELKNVMTTGISRLSGGEARRVDLGIELLSSPGLIFLDEPLAGLDPGLVKRFMALFRRIADQGHTLVLITHTLEQLEFCDRVLFFNKGKIVFQGPPAEIPSRFNVKTIADVYEKASLLPEPRLLKADNVQRKVSNRSIPVTVPGKKQSVTISHQVTLLVIRYFRLFLRDRKNFILFLGQAPVLASLLYVVFNNPGRYLPLSFYFCLTVSTVWMGGISSIRAIAAEWPILKREYRAGLSLNAYLLSKLTHILFSSFLTGVLFYSVLVLFLHSYDLNRWLLLLICSGTVSGAILGLCISALSTHSGIAVTALPLVFIPQIFFSGILIPFDRMSQIGAFLSQLTVSRPLFAIFKQVCILHLSFGTIGEWQTLFFLLTGLIILTRIAIFFHIVDR